RCLGNFLRLTQSCQRAASSIRQKTIADLSQLPRFIAQHRRVGIAWANAVYANVLRTVVDCHSLGQQHHGSFGGAIRCSLGASRQAPAGSSIDDRPPARARHDGNRLLRHQKDRFDIHTHHAVPIFFTGFENGSAPNNTSIVEENADTSKKIESALDDTVTIGAVRYVRRFKLCASAAGGDFLFHLSPCGLVQREIQNRRSFSSKQQGSSAADARGRAGNNGGFSLQPLSSVVHCFRGREPASSKTEGVRRRNNYRLANPPAVSAPSQV